MRRGGRQALKDVSRPWSAAAVNEIEGTRIRSLFAAASSCTSVTCEEKSRRESIQQAAFNQGSHTQSSSAVVKAHATSGAEPDARKESEVGEEGSRWVQEDGGWNVRREETRFKESDSGRTRSGGSKLCRGERGRSRW